MRTRQAYFNRFCIDLTLQDALDASHQGDCYEDVKALVSKSYIRRQLNTIPADKIADELREYGAWDETELADDQANIYRLLWIAACDIREESRGKG